MQMSIRLISAFYLPAFMLRAIKPIPLVGLRVRDIPSSPPTFGWAGPKTLLVEPEYQRDLSKRSITLIRHIAANFDWLHIKPPVCAHGAGGKLCVVDGQHTAIAAASRGVPKIPVMVIEAPEMKRRAKAFVAHNTDRLAITPMQLFHSRVAAADPGALAVMRVAQGSGVTICRSQPATGYWTVGETVAIAGIESLIRARGEEKAVKVLKTLVAAKRGPVATHEIRAAEALIFNSSYGWQHSVFDLVTVIRSKSIDAWRGQVLGRMKEGEKMPVWKAVAKAWVRAGNRD